MHASQRDQRESMGSRHLDTDASLARQILQAEGSLPTQLLAGARMTTWLASDDADGTEVEEEEAAAGTRRHMGEKEAR